MNAIVLSFLLTLSLFLVVGLWAMRHSRGTSHDYLIASRSIPAWLAGLSAVATNNSGYMFIGMIGYTYTAGLSSIWLMIGWIVGDLIASLNVHRSIRIMAQRRHAHSFSGLIAHWQGEEFIRLRRIVGALTLMFLTLYAAAQLSAGSKALESVLDLHPSIGAFGAAVMILFYSLSGGLRASIWTDALQAIVMIGSMALLLFSALKASGGIEHTFATLQTIQLGYMSWFPLNMQSHWLDIGGFVIGWLFGGIGVIGQPHIMIRYIALDSTRSLNRMRFYYYGWFALFYAATIGVGLMARVLLDTSQEFDPETALLVLSSQILSPALVGIMLAGIFAATISTADSLILSCSASLTRDFTKKPIESYRMAKLGTLVVTLTALLIALSSSKSVFALVLDAWGLFASTLGPIIALLAFGAKPSEKQMIALIAVGGALFYFWPFISDIYAIAPAWAGVFVVYFLMYIRVRK